MPQFRKVGKDYSFSAQEVYATSPAVETATHVALRNGQLSSFQQLNLVEEEIVEE